MAALGLACLVRTDPLELRRLLDVLQTLRPHTSGADRIRVDSLVDAVREELAATE